MRRITGRGVTGYFFQSLEEGIEGSFIDALAGVPYESNSADEEYTGLSGSAGLSKYEGAAKYQELTEQAMILRNEEYQDGIKIPKRDIRRDKTRQVQDRIAGFAEGANNHWYELLAELALLGETKLCYDGKPFFASNHEEGKSGVQSNIVTFDLGDDSVVPSDYRGTPTNPSTETARAAVMAGVQRMLGFLNDQGKGINRNAKEFLIQASPSLLGALSGAIALPFVAQGQSNNLVALENVRFRLQADPLLNDWDNEFAIYRTDGVGKPYILQEELPIELSLLAEGSDFETLHNAWLMSIMTSRAAGYGQWTRAVKVKLQA